jgi:TolA-binding protein
MERFKDEEAKARLDEIIRDYPGTPSAQEAKRLRDELGKP